MNLKFYINTYMELNAIKGMYSFTEGKLVPDRNMTLINTIIDKSQVIPHGGQDTPEFCYDPTTKVYLELVEAADYSATLKKVDINYIKKNYPHVKYWITVDIHRPKL